jgi:polyferredoxin
VICAALATSLELRSPFKVDVVRDRAALARQVEDGVIENDYHLQIMNATELQQRYRISVGGLSGLALREPLSVEVTPTEARWISLALRLPAESAQRATPGAHEIHFTIDRPGPTPDVLRSLREKSTFVIPR